MSQQAIFAAGCFWGVEAGFRQIPGVEDAISGYTGGHAVDPTYPRVCSGTTGHAEAVEVTFDPAVVSYGRLLDAFWKMHDPTQMNRQGPDVGTQYRSAIFFLDAEQQRSAAASRDALQATLTKPIATEVTAASTFYPAEAYHQRYAERNGVVCHVPTA